VWVTLGRPSASRCSNTLYYSRHVEEVDWTHRADYMLARHGVTVAEATEALGDPAAVTFDPDPASRSGQSIRVIGWSATAGAVLTIILARHAGVIYGSNGWRSNPADLRAYIEEDE
jgi:hypothetical protein